MRHLHPRALVAVSASFKLLQFMDRGVQNGSPLEFDLFIQRTTCSTQTAFLFGALGSAYTVGTIAGCIGTAMLLVRRTSAHRLMRDGMVVASAGMLLSSFGFWMSDSMGTFAFYVLARAITGVGGGGVSMAWPPYLESCALASERSLSMTIVETGTALGAAMGFVFSAAMSSTVGWGAAYVTLTLLMASLAASLACTTTAVRSTSSTSREQPPAAAEMDSGDSQSSSSPFACSSRSRSQPRAQLLDTRAGTSSSSSLPEEAQEAAPSSSVAEDGAAADADAGPGRDAGSRRTWARLCAAPGLGRFLCGCSFGSAALTGMQAFFPAIAVAIGLWPTEVQASTMFGGGIVMGALVGGVCHGLVADRVAERLTRRLRRGATSSGGSSGEASIVREGEAAVAAAKDDSTPPRPPPPPHATPTPSVLLPLLASSRAEARMLTRLIACTMLIGGLLTAALSRVMVARLAALALIGIMLCGALLLGSLGLQVRTPLLLVPETLRPGAVLLGTLAGYAGEFIGPLVVGSAKDALAPRCKTVEDPDHDGKHVIDPRCTADRASQAGLGVVMLTPCAFAVAAALIWAHTAAWRMQHGRARADCGEATPCSNRAAREAAACVELDEVSR